MLILFKFRDSLQAFVKKNRNWRRKINSRNIAMFERLSSKGEHKLDPALKAEIVAHLGSLDEQFDRYIPDLSQVDQTLVRYPFFPFLDIACFPNETQDEYIDMKNDSSSRVQFDRLCQLWTIPQSCPLGIEDSNSVCLNLSLRERFLKIRLNQDQGKEQTGHGRRCQAGVVFNTATYYKTHSNLLRCALELLRQEKSKYLTSPCHNWKQGSKFK